MKPLLFANWSSINRIFCTAMWMVALMLAMAILLHTVNASAHCASSAAAAGKTAGKAGTLATQCNAGGVQARLLLR